MLWRNGIPGTSVSYADELRNSPTTTARAVNHHFLLRRLTGAAFYLTALRRRHGARPLRTSNLLTLESRCGLRKTVVRCKVVPRMLPWCHAPPGICLRCFPRVRLTRRTDLRIYVRGKGSFVSVLTGRNAREGVKKKTPHAATAAALTINIKVKTSKNIFGEIVGVQKRIWNSQWVRNERIFLSTGACWRRQRAASGASRQYCSSYSTPKNNNQIERFYTGKNQAGIMTLRFHAWGTFFINAYLSFVSLRFSEDILHSLHHIQQYEAMKESALSFSEFPNYFCRRHSQTTADDDRRRRSQTAFADGNWSTFFYLCAQL